MVLKRKRSDSGLVFGSSTFLSPLGPGSSSFNFDAISAMDTARRGFFSTRQPTPSHLPSRTLKRFRDNRPPESEVHRRSTRTVSCQPANSHRPNPTFASAEHTLNLLYSAQQQHHHVQLPPSTAPENTEPAIPTQPHAATAPTTQRGSSRSDQQRSLHAFWNLPVSSPSPSPASSAASSPSALAAAVMDRPMPSLSYSSFPPTCEDCGAGLAGDDEDDVMMMDLDGYGGLAGCGACGRAVCFSCSVSNLGEHRRCLVCAGRG